MHKGKIHIGNTALNEISRMFFFLFRRLSRYHLKRFLFGIIFIQFILFIIIWSSSYKRTTEKALTQQQILDLEHQTRINPHLVDPDYEYFRNSNNNNGNDVSDDYISFLSDYFSSWYSSDGSDMDQSVADVDTVSRLYEKFRYNTKPFWFDDYTLQKNLLTIPYGPNRGQKWTCIDDIQYYNSDPRLIWSVYMDYIINNYPQHNQKNIAYNWKFPFSWYDWIDMHDLNKLISLNETRLTCEFLFEGSFYKDTLLKIENEVGETLFDNGRSKYDQDGWYVYAKQYGDNDILGKLKDYCTYLVDKPKFSTGLNITKQDPKCRPEVFQLQNRNYVYSSLKPPLSLSVTALNGKTYQFYFDQNGPRQNMIESNLLQDFIKNNLDLPSLNNTQNLLDYNDLVFNHFEKFNNFLENYNISKNFVVNVKETDSNLINLEELILDEADFEFDPIAKIKELEAIPEEEMTPHFKNYLDSLRTSITYAPEFSPKYFQESGDIQDYYGIGYHRDSRFFNVDSFLFDKQEYANRLNSMIRTFQKFTLSNGIISWLSHGTLYGYMFNGETFPWDEDFDLQLPIKHLNYLAQYFNQSIILQDPREGNGRYLIDVSSSITVRTKGNGNNNIDARFIDLDSGLYIDLTGLSVSSIFANVKVRGYMQEQLKELHLHTNNSVLQVPEDSNAKNSDYLGLMDIYQLHDYVHKNNKEFSESDRSSVDKFLREEQTTQRNINSMEKLLKPAQRYYLHKIMKLYNCRNNHISPLSYLSPMYNRMFHGVPAFVPKKYLHFLKNEYYVSEDYAYITYKSHVFFPGVMHWVNEHFVKKCSNINNWYRDTKKLSNITSIEQMEFKDMKTFVANMKFYGTDDMTTFANLYNAFDQFAYRMKELAIEFDPTLKQKEKKELLNILKNQCSEKIKSPGKDALLYVYEKRLFKKLARNFDPALIEDVKDSIDKMYLNKYWKQLLGLKNRELSLFHTNFESSSEYIVRPSNSTSKLVDMNYQGRKDMYPDKFSNCPKLFSKDPN
ncbi:hypothetical protein RI543_002032 [Arxiozyma heterogenica]|uniref:LicD/FKTN/FKRP nucleotidyltransferase domain-containing protein n=1 Tax=Arxiozyma heterogenica TaxID=278026 RepID=A0AAN7WIR4_9SACH|nr:hypothetical protein RI543_002032 [Kazachstania heterogenica]